jgi:predicted RNase H-like HicB family nuclease
VLTGPQQSRKTTVLKCLTTPETSRASVPVGEVATGFEVGGTPSAEAARAMLTWITRRTRMRLKVVVHRAEEGGYWAEVPAIPGCATQGESFEELLENLYEAVEGCLSVDVDPATAAEGDRVMDIAI